MGRMEDALRKAAEERERRKLASGADTDGAPPGNGTIMVPVDDAPDARRRGPVLARSSGTIDERLVVYHGPSDPRAEQFRKTRANLLALRPTPKSIMLTSGVAGEGTSLAAANLALTLLETDTGDVLVIDANLRHPQMSQLFAMRPGPGFSEIVSGSVTNPATCIQKSDIPGLSLLAAGTAGVQAARLLEPSTLKAVIDAIGAPFKFIVVDAPPATDFADTSLMAQDVDGVVLVVAIGRGKRAATRKTVELLENTRSRVLGTLVLGGA